MADTITEQQYTQQVIATSIPSSHIHHFLRIVLIDSCYAEITNCNHRLLADYQYWRHSL